MSVKPTNFLGLPLVVQTEVAKCLPMQGLAEGAAVSKLFKKAVEADNSWSTIAKEMGVPRQNNLKDKVKETHEKNVKEAVATIVNGGFDNELQALWTEGEKKEILGLENPYEQRNKLIEIYRTKPPEELGWIWFAIRTGLKSIIEQPDRAREKGVVKILLKGGFDIFAHPCEGEFQQLFVSAGEKDDAIFKAYVQGKKGGLEREVTLAMMLYSPSFLKQVLGESTISHVALAIFCVLTTEQKSKAKGIWELVMAKYPNKPNALKVFQEARDFFASRISDGLSVKKITSYLEERLKGI